MRRLVGILLVVALIGIAANDIMRVADAARHLREATYDLTNAAASNAKNLSRDQMAAFLYTDAAARGVTLYAYDQTDRRVRVYASQTVGGTIVAGPVYNLLAGASLSEALAAPLTIRDHRNVGIIQ